MARAAGPGAAAAVGRSVARPRAAAGGGWTLSFPRGPDRHLHEVELGASGAGRRAGHAAGRRGGRRDDAAHGAPRDGSLAMGTGVGLGFPDDGDGRRARG